MKIFQDPLLFNGAGETTNTAATETTKKEQLKNGDDHFSSLSYVYNNNYTSFIKNPLSYFRNIEDQIESEIRLKQTKQARNTMNNNTSDPSSLYVNSNEMTMVPNYDEYGNNNDTSIEHSSISVQARCSKGIYFMIVCIRFLLLAFSLGTFILDVSVGPNKNHFWIYFGYLTHWALVFAMIYQIVVAFYSLKIYMEQISPSSCCADNLLPNNEENTNDEKNNSTSNEPTATINTNSRSTFGPFLCLIYSLAVTTQVSVTFLFWFLLYDPNDDDNDVNFYDVSKHGIIALMVLLDGLFIGCDCCLDQYLKIQTMNNDVDDDKDSASSNDCNSDILMFMQPIPLYITYLKHILITALCYLIWNCLHGMSGIGYGAETDDEDDALYSALRWQNNFTEALSVSFFTLFLFLPIVYLSLWFVFWSRIRWSNPLVFTKSTVSTGVRSTTTTTTNICECESQV